MADHIPFITSAQALKLVSNIYSDSIVLRVSLDVAQKLSLKNPSKVWIDPGVDGLHDLASRSKESAWYKLMKTMPGFDKIGAPGFIAKPNSAVIQVFINAILERTAKLNPTWITVPQLPFLNDSLRNKINRELAMATGRWKSSVGFTGRLIFPLIFTHAEQTKGKTQRTPKLQQANRCYHESQADGYWVVDTSLTEEIGSVALRNKRFKSVIDLHQELNDQISSRIRIAGPYWGMNLVLWSRGLVDFPAIGVGGTYQYYPPGGHSRPASARVAIGPLRRRVGIPLLNAWLAKTAKIIGPLHPAYAEIDKIQKQLPLLRNPDTARIQVANFYKKWFDSISGVPAIGRSLALFQDLSQAFALGRSLMDFSNEGAARRAESVVEPLMVNCL
jgi:hypothetical protein